MGAKTEALANQFEAKVQEAVAVLEQLSAGDWKKITEAEHWTVGVTSHRLPSALEPVAGIVSTMVSRESLGHFTQTMLEELKARHAQEHAHCTRVETIALLRKGTGERLARG
jgi:hypothetical protein